MKKIIYILVLSTLTLTCSTKSSDDSFSYNCNNCTRVNLLSSCDITNGTRIEINCTEYARLLDIRNNNTDACIEITVQPKDGSDPVSGWGRDFFFVCDFD